MSEVIPIEHDETVIQYFFKFLARYWVIEEKTNKTFSLEMKLVQLLLGLVPAESIINFDIKESVEKDFIFNKKFLTKVIVKSDCFFMHIHVFWVIILLT